MSVIYISFYVSNVIKYEMMKSTKRHDSFTFDRLCDGNVKLPFIDTRKDTGPFVRALIESALGKTLLAFTAVLSSDEIARLWSRATGQPAKQRHVTMEEVKQQFPTEGEETNSVMYAAEFGYAGSELGVLEPKDLGFETRPGDIEAWMREQDWSQTASPKSGVKM